MKHLLAILFFLFICVQTYTQDFIWWNEVHNWDGYSHYTQYQTHSTSFMGPNALPVPEIKWGKLEEDLTFEFAFDEHFSPGDQTQNLYTRIFYPVTKGKIGLELSVVPVEYYQNDIETRDSRASRDYDGKGFSGGDIYIATYYQIVKDHRILPDILFTFNFKTPSGDNVEAARFTDMIAYFLDLSIGKDILKKETFSLRAFALIGFYCYDTYDFQHQQNDAPIYGIGFNAEFNKFIFGNSLGGYSGYLNIGDKPMVYRAYIYSKFSNNLNLKFQYQQGLRDFPYTSFRISALINFK